MKIKSIFKKDIKGYIKSKIRNRVFFRRSYSQEGEDMILARIFEKTHDGFYVDVGACHPKRFSNTYFFYQLGWRGINIDATPGSMDLFNKFRPRDINLEEAVGDSKEILTYYIFNEPALNSFSKELSEKRNGKNNFIINTAMKLEIRTLREILDKYLPVNREISFLSVDVEGFDLSVLKSNDWRTYRPKIVLVEDLNRTLDNIGESEIYCFMRSQNYGFAAKTANTLFFSDLENYER